MTSCIFIFIIITLRVVSGHEIFFFVRLSLYDNKAVPCVVARCRLGSQSDVCNDFALPIGERREERNGKNLVFFVL